jgi:autotransporter passenger strand-loop-strand repeat protein
VAAGAVLSGSVQSVLRGGVANGTVVSGGVETVLGTANGTVVNTGGSAVVSSGGAANSMVVSGGRAVIQSGGAVSGATLFDGTLEIDNGGLVSSSTITFSGGGTLVVDGTKFRGKIAGFDSPEEKIDLTTIDFATATLGYAGNSLSGVLTATDGVDTIKLTMLGNYTLANFKKEDDGNGGTLISDPPVDSSGHLAPGH